jgi:hypothetical protein
VQGTLLFVRGRGLGPGCARGRSLDRVVGSLNPCPVVVRLVACHMTRLTLSNCRLYSPDLALNSCSGFRGNLLHAGHTGYLVL